MSGQFELYKCGTCFAIVEVFQGGAGTLACCDAPMMLVKAGVTDASEEKHVPVAAKTEQGIQVKVGEIAHPMAADHWTQWVELLGDNFCCTHFLNPGDASAAEFKCGCKGKVVVRAYCNLHGLWETVL